MLDCALLEKIALSRLPRHLMETVTIVAHNVAVFINLVLLLQVCKQAIVWGCGGCDDWLYLVHLGKLVCAHLCDQRYSAAECWHILQVQVS